MEFLLDLLYNLNMLFKEKTMEELKKHKGFKVFILLFAFVVLIFIQEGNQEKFISFIDKLIGKDMDLVLYKEYPGNNLIYYKGSILQWENNSLIFLNEDGSQAWVKDFSFQEPDIVLGDRYIYAVDKSTGDVYKINNLGDTILRIQLETPIFNLKESGKYIIAHVKDENDRLIIVDEEGKKILNEPIQENILTYQVKDDGSQYVYSTIKIDGTNILSEIFVYNTGGEIEYSMGFKDEIVFSTEFIDDKIVLLTDNNLRVIHNGKEKWSRDYPLIKDISISNNRINLLYGNNLDILDFKGEVKNKIALGIEYKKIVPLEKSIGLYGNKNLSILQNGKEIIKYIGEKDIIDLSKYNDYIALQYDDYIEVYKLEIKD